MLMLILVMVAMVSVRLLHVAIHQHEDEHHPSTEISSILDVGTKPSSEGGLDTDSFHAALHHASTMLDHSAKAQATGMSIPLPVQGPLAVAVDSALSGRTVSPLLRPPAV